MGMRACIIRGDCVEVLATLTSGSVQRIICDPPYGLEFLSQEWDRLGGVVLHDPSVVGGFQDGAGGNPYSRARVRYGTYRGDGVGTGGARFTSDGMGKGFAALPAYTGSPNPLCRSCGGSRRDRKGFKVCRCDVPDFPNLGAAQGARIEGWHASWLREVARTLEPGGVVKAFGGTRTIHRVAAAMEDVGLEVLGMTAWAYGSGFPKNLDVGKALDNRAGVTRAVKGPPPYRRGRAQQAYSETRRVSYDYPPSPVTVATSPEAVLWDGWGTALKPSWEPVVVGRRP